MAKSKQQEKKLGNPSRRKIHRPDETAAKEAPRLIAPPVVAEDPIALQEWHRVRGRLEELGRIDDVDPTALAQ